MAARRACKTCSPRKGVSGVSRAAAPAERPQPGTLAAPSVGPVSPGTLPTHLPRGPAGPPGDGRGCGGAPVPSAGSVPAVADRAHASRRNGAGRVREDPGSAHTRKWERAPRGTGTRVTRGTHAQPAGGLGPAPGSRRAVAGTGSLGGTRQARGHPRARGDSQKRNRASPLTTRPPQTRTPAGRQPATGRSPPHPTA